jgi:hypothetical protein
MTKIQPIASMLLPDRKDDRQRDTGVTPALQRWKMFSILTRGAVLGGRK